MADLSKEEIDQALRAVAAMISRTEGVGTRFAQGTSQHTLQMNRLNALKVAASLLAKERAESDVVDCYTKADLEKAVAPIASLISKSEKAQGKLAQGTWQHTMLGDNLKALHMALPLLAKALSE